MFSLGTLYENGPIIKKDPEVAFYWYKKGAEAGDIHAIDRMIRIYENGELKEKMDQEKASEWHKKATHARPDILNPLMD